MKKKLKHAWLARIALAASLVGVAAPVPARAQAATSRAISSEDASPEQRVREILKSFGEGSNSARAIEDLREIYAEWRHALGSFLADKGESAEVAEHLLNVSTGKFNAILAKMSEDPKWSESFRKLRPAALRAYEFLRDHAVGASVARLAPGFGIDAMKALSDRSAGAAGSGSGPNFLDEPANREEVLQSLLSRVSGDSVDGPSLEGQVQQTRDYLAGLSVPSLGLRSHAFELKDGAAADAESVRLDDAWVAPANDHATVARFLVSALRRIESRTGAGFQVVSEVKADAIRGMLRALAVATRTRIK